MEKISEVLILDTGQTVKLEGEKGTTFTPSVDANGNLSWTNDGGKQNPTTVNIKGEKGTSDFVIVDDHSGAGDDPNKIYIPSANAEKENATAIAAEEARARAAEADRYTKSETYTKTEVNDLVDTPHQEYVTVDAYSNLPATGSKDTIYRVSNYNGSTSQVDITSYSEYAWNGSSYTFLCVKSQIGEVFDISVYKNNTKYADLAAALNGGTNIPQSLQKGGMSVKFIQSSDNKYVQYRLMAQTFTTDTTQWQGVDDKPTAGSDNLVKSGGVANIINNNLLPKFGVISKFFNGGILNTGNENTDSEHQKTDYIEVKKGDIIEVKLKEGSASWNVISYYNEAREYQQNISITNNAYGIIVIPDNVSYIRFSFIASFTPTIKLYCSDTSKELFAQTESKLQKQGFELSGNVIEKYVNLPFILKSGDKIKIATNNGASRVFLIDKTYSSKVEVDATIGNGQWNVVTIPSGFSCNCIYFYNSTLSNDIEYLIKKLPSAEYYYNSIERLNEDTEELRTTRFVGGILATGAESAAATEYEHSDYIEVVDGFDFRVKSTCGSSSWCCVACYYADKTYVAEKSFTWSYDGVLSVDVAVKYIRIAGLSNYPLSVEYAQKESILLNTSTNLKYPSLVSERACFAIQIDGSYTYAQHQKFIDIAREYGLMSIDFANNPRLSKPNPNPADSKWFAKMQQEGCEMIYHNLIGTKSDFSEESTLTVEQLRNNLVEEIVDFRNLGYTPYGVVANEGKLADRYREVVDDLFLWKVTISTHILTNQTNETTKSSYLADKEIHRMGFDLPLNHTDSDEADAINKGKQWIDNICTNKSMGVMYAHALDATMIPGITENVFRAICAYLQNKIANGQLVYANTSECLNYLCM